MPRSAGVPLGVWTKGGALKKDFVFQIHSVPVFRYESILVRFQDQPFDSHMKPNGDMAKALH